MSDSHGTARVWAALAVVYVVWGSTYLAIDLAVETMPSLLMLAVRCCCSATVVWRTPSSTPRRVSSR